jgi:hypothetical protein
MARSDTRFSVYPAPKAVEVIGNTSPALNQAIECWAALLARATAANGRLFQQADPTEMHFENILCQMNEWSLLAKALKGLRFDPELAIPGPLLATAVEDAHTLVYSGSECLNWGNCDSTVIKDKDIDAEVKKTVEKLRSLDYAHAWAVIVAVQWFWEHHDEGIDINQDPWWTLAFRRTWKERQLSKKSSDEAEQQQPRTAPRKGKRRAASKEAPRTGEA